MASGIVRIAFKKMMFLLKGAAALYAISNIIFFGTIFLADIFIARTFDLNNVGYWKQIILLIQVTIPFFSLGIIEGFKYEISRERNKLPDFLGSIMAGIAAISICILLVFSNKIIVGQIAEWVGIKSIIQIAIWIPLLFFILALINVFQYIAIVNNQVFIIFYSAIIFAISFLISLYLFIHFTEVDFIYKILYSFLAAYLLQLLYYLYVIKPSIAFSTVFLHSKSYLKYGFPLFIATYIGLITLNIDKVIVNKLGGTAQFAIYSIGALEIPIIALLVKSITTIAYPEIVKNIVENNMNKASKIWFDNLIKISYISFPIIIVFMFFSKEIIVGFYGQKYLAAVPVFKAYCLILLWRNSIYGTILSVSGKTILITVYSAVAFVVNLILCFVFYKYFGIVGVIYSTFISITILHFLIMGTEKLIFDFFKLFIKHPIFAILYGLVILTYFLR
jgi:O-antigen/teichoic acid export membrane protein